MIKRLSLCCVVLVFFAVAARAGQIEPPKLDPVPPTEKQEAIIAEGVALHDNRDYDGAIKKYKEVLEQNPDCVEALYEMSYSYFAKQDYKTSVEIARRGIKYKSRLLAGFYEQIGNALDSAGDTKQAIEYYKAGIATSKKSGLLYFNIALAYGNLGNINEYKLNLKKSVVSVPGHSSSQLALGEYFYKSDYKIPAVLVLARFLTLEPTSSRSDTAYKKFQDILGSGVSQGKDSNTINIFMNTNAKKDEGDFGPIELFLGLSKAASLSDKNKGKTRMELFVSQMESFFAVVSETDAKDLKSSFVWNYYSPYFKEMKKQKFVEAFCYYISQKNGDPDVQKWLAANQAKAHEFLAWSKDFVWPSVEP